MDEPAPRQHEHRPARIALLGIALFVLLGLVAAASRAHHLPGTHSGIHQPPRGVGNYLFSIFAVVFVGGFFALLFLWFSERDLLAEARRKRQGKATYKALALILALGLLAAILTRFGFHFRPFHRGGSSGNGVPLGQATNKSHGKLSNGQPRPPSFEWLPVVIATAAGVTLLGFIGLRSMRRRRDELVERFVLEQQFEALLDDTLDDLHAQKDPRKAIVAAYARMERLFASSGVPRRPSEAPLEYLARALGELRASGAALGRLTGLFEWAKFSKHEVDETMRQEAIVALTEVRDELRAKRDEDELRRAAAQRHAEERLGAQVDAERGRTFGEDPFAAAAEKMRGSLEGRRGA